MNKAYKFRIYPDKEQKILFEKTFGCVRFVYNYYLDIKIPQYQMDQSSLNYTWYADDLAKLLKTEDYAFLKEVDCIALKQSLYHLDNDFQDFSEIQQSVFQNLNQRKLTWKVVQLYGSMAMLQSKTMSSGLLK